MPLAALVLAMIDIGCGTTVAPSPSPVTPPQQQASAVLTAADVDSIVKATAASVNVPVVIGITDRSGNILAIYKKANAPATAVGNFSQIEPSDQVAVSLAMSASFFSDDQAPVSTRTIRFLSATHFPPGVALTASGPLYGIENTNRGCALNVTYLPGQSLPVPTALTGGPGPGILTGKPTETDSNSDNLVVNPGGVPIFKNGLVSRRRWRRRALTLPRAEYAAYAGTVLNGFAAQVPAPGVVVLNGFTLPFVSQTTIPAGETTGVADGSYEIAPQPSPGPTPQGDLIAETGSTLGGLSLVQVQAIVQATVATANLTRSALRLPVGARSRFTIAVADLDGSLLALYRMPDATTFSTDVAAAKARNASISPPQPENSIRSPLEPPSPTGRSASAPNRCTHPASTAPHPAPSSISYQFDVANPCTQGHQPANPNQNGVVFFPGSVPLFVNGKLVGGLGVSGDGVDQDDWAAAGGATGFEAPANIRADQILIRNVRLPYQKFPRNPEE